MSRRLGPRPETKYEQRHRAMQIAAVLIAATQPRKEAGMENQHREISGYRELDQAEIDLMNEIKAQGIALGVLVAKLRAASTLDQRWVSIGATDLQTGLMALTRAVAKPEFF